MASKPVMDAIEAKLSAAWNAIAPAIPISLPNDRQGGAPSDASAFLTLEYPVANEEQISIGSPDSNVFRESGAFRVFLSIPIGAGRDPWVGYIDDLRAAFRGQSFGGVTIFAPSPSATNDKSDDGNYFLVSFAAPYYFDFLG